MSSPAPVRLPASIRNRNPGAMYPGAASKKFGSTSHQVLKSKDGTHLIATFPSHVQGAAAQIWLLASPSYANGQRTVRDVITKWCGGFYVSTYLQVLETQAGVRRDAVLTRGMVCNPEIAIPLARAMAWQEAGQEYPLDDTGWREAHALALPEALAEAVPTPATATGQPTETAPIGPTPADQAEAATTPIPTTDAGGWDRSTRSKPEGRIKDAAASSWTLRGAAAAAAAWVADAWNDTTQAISHAFDAAATYVGSGTPGGRILASMQLSTKSLFVCLGLSAVAIVIARRFAAADEGGHK